MIVKEQVINRLDSLTKKASQLLNSVDGVDYEDDDDVINNFSDYVNTEKFAEWQSQSLAFLNNLLGSNHTYTKAFEEKVKNSLGEDVKVGKGILSAVNNDIKDDYLYKIEALVSASIFSDFLEMADYLIAEGYKDPAASLIGAVLEDGLRKICTFHDIDFKENKDDISSLNNKLASKNIYDRLTQRKIQVWNDLRNNADHGHFDKYKIEDVKEMQKGVNDFLEQYLHIG